MEEKTEEEIQKELITLRRESDVKFHKEKMAQLEYIRETILIGHEKELERQRIKTAEIKKTFDRKRASQYPRGRF